MFIGETYTLHVPRVEDELIVTILYLQLIVLVINLSWNTILTLAHFQPDTAKCIFHHNLETNFLHWYWWTGQSSIVTFLNVHSHFILEAWKSCDLYLCINLMKSNNK
jgi:hypothetical protein